MVDSASYPPQPLWVIVPGENTTGYRGGIINQDDAHQNGDVKALNPALRDFFEKF